MAGNLVVQVRNHVSGLGISGNDGLGIVMGSKVTVISSNCNRAWNLGDVRKVPVISVALF